MDSKDRPISSVPAVPARSGSTRLAVQDASAGRPATEAPQVSINFLRVVVRAVTRHWWQILLLWVIGTGGLWYLISVNIKPQYESAALLKIEPFGEDLFGSNKSANFEPYLETQVQLI